MLGLVTGHFHITFSYNFHFQHLMKDKQLKSGVTRTRTQVLDAQSSNDLG